MRPAARIQAAIDIIEALEPGPSSLDRLMRRYFRQRRYAGARDRAAIADRVHLVLRRRAELIWRCGDAPSPRLQVLASLRWCDGETPAAIDALCSGQDHAPAPLQPAERAALTAPDADIATAPAWVRDNHPGWLDDSLDRAFGDSRAAEMAALNRQAALDLRVNALRASRRSVAERLEADGHEVTSTPLTPFGLRLPGRPDLRQHRLFREGMIEVQDEGSQVVAALARPPAGGTAVDYCAGAGGKTLAMAAGMTDGVVHAVDVDARRLQRLSPRLSRAGADNVRTHHLTGDDDPWLDDMAASVDSVLVDAPCSGLGAWRRQPEARWRLDPASLAAVCRTQQAILRRAATLVRPGGLLAYATCSLLGEENEDQIADFLSATGEFEVVPMARIWSKYLPGEAPGEGPYLRLSPARHGCDGFFVAVLQRQAKPLDSVPTPT